MQRPIEKRYNIQHGTIIILFTTWHCYFLLSNLGIDYFVLEKPPTIGRSLTITLYNDVHKRVF